MDTLEQTCSPKAWSSLFHENPSFFGPLWVLEKILLKIRSFPQPIDEGCLFRNQREWAFFEPNLSASTTQSAFHSLSSLILSITHKVSILQMRKAEVQRGEVTYQCHMVYRTEFWELLYRTGIWGQVYELGNAPIHPLNFVLKRNKSQSSC